MGRHPDRQMQLHCSPVFMQGDRCLRAATGRSAACAATVVNGCCCAVDGNPIDAPINTSLEKAARARGAVTAASGKLSSPN